VLKKDGPAPDGHFECGLCGPFPRIGGIPILIAEPHEWCAVFRDAALAALAEQGLAERRSIVVLDAFASAAPRAEPMRFGDDWTLAEGNDEELPGLREPRLRAILDQSKGRTPRRWLNARLRKPAETLAEIGCGAGMTSSQLAQNAKHLIVIDSSLRAVLRARQRASKEAAEVCALVADAEALPLKKGKFDALVAENLVDLLDEPRAFLKRASRALRPYGQLLVTTPDPSLGTGDDGELERAALKCGFRRSRRAENLIWTRVHSERHAELYLAQGLELSK
jgi:ubiquinone/menaquinone biosynthesis C-methylase UbiE